MMTKSKYFQSLILFELLWVFYITVLRALRWPNDWAEAHWLISYKFGLLKRALPGTLIAPFINSGNISPSLVIKMVSTSFFLLFCAALFCICVRIIKKSQFNINTILVVLVFLTSPYIVISAHLNGYFDNIVIIISIFACLLITRKKIWLSAIILTVGVFIHETIFLVGLPSVIFLALIQHAKEVKVKGPAQLFVGCLSRYKLLVIIPTLALSCIVINQTFLDPAIIKNQLISHLSQFDFIEQYRNVNVPNAFTTSFFDYLAHQGPKFIHSITDLTYIIRIGLPLFILLNYAWHNFRMVVCKKLVFLSLMLIALLPLSLHCIAWDTSRIWTYPLIIVMLAVWGISEMYPAVGTKERTPVFSCIFAIMVIVFQIFMLMPLMDETQERYSIVQRILLYAPLLIFLAIFVLKNFYLKRIRAALDHSSTKRRSAPD